MALALFMAQGVTSARIFLTSRSTSQDCHIHLFGKRFLGRGWATFGCEPDKLYVGVFLCLGLGDRNSTDIAQEVHMEALRKGGDLHEPGASRWRHPFPLSDTLQGVYIDDGFVAGIVPNALKHAPGPDSRLRGQTRQALREAGLAVADEKGFGTFGLHPE